MPLFQWCVVRVVAVVLVATVASGGCAKPSTSKIWAGEPGIPSDAPTGDSARDLLLAGFMESAAPTGFGEADGRWALDVSRAATELLDAAPLYTYSRDPAAMASIEESGHIAAQVMTAVSRDLDTAQALVADRGFRHGLLLAQHLDPAGAAALLERATARTAPTAADAEENARIVRDLFVDLAQDPYGWREEIPKGSAISDAITKIAAEHIDAFSMSHTGSKPLVYRAAEIADGFLSRVEVDGRDAEDVLTFVAAGREPGTPDKDLITLYAAAQAYTRDRVVHAIEGSLDPSTALIQAGTVANSVSTADFRSSMYADESVDAAWSAVYDDVSAVAGIPLGCDVDCAAGAAPCWIGDASSAVVEEAVGRFGPESIAAAEGQRTLDDIVRIQDVAISHLIVSAYQQAGVLPADTPDLDAVTDEAGQVSDLDSFRDDQIDSDVTGDDVGPQDALAQIARSGPAAEKPEEWASVLRYYREAASMKYVDVDRPNPAPRSPLGSELVDAARRSDRHGDPIPWPLANPMTFPPDTSTPAAFE